MEQTTQSISARKSYINKIESTYSEVKTNGRYKGFELSESWKVVDYKSRIFWGHDQSLLRSWISPKAKRWNEDGTWNW